VVEHFTHIPNIEGLNPATCCQKKEMVQTQWNIDRTLHLYS